MPLPVALLAPSRRAANGLGWGEDTWVGARQAARAACVCPGGLGGAPVHRGRVPARASRLGSVVRGSGVLAAAGRGPGSRPGRRKGKVGLDFRTNVRPGVGARRSPGAAAWG